MSCDIWRASTSSGKFILIASKAKSKLGFLEKDDPIHAFGKLKKQAEISFSYQLKAKQDVMGGLKSPALLILLA